MASLPLLTPADTSTVLPSLSWTFSPTTFFSLTTLTLFSSTHWTTMKTILVKLIAIEERTWVNNNRIFDAQAINREDWKKSAKSCFTSGRSGLWLVHERIRWINRLKYQSLVHTCAVSTTQATYGQAYAQEKRNMFLFSCAYAYVACVMLIAQVWTRLNARSMWLPRDSHRGDGSKLYWKFGGKPTLYRDYSRE